MCVRVENDAENFVFVVSAPAVVVDDDVGADEWVFFLFFRFGFV